MKSLEYATDMSKCHGAVVWSIDKNILRFTLKNITHLAACFAPSMVRNGSLGAPAFVKLAYKPIGDSDWLQNVSLSGRMPT